MPPRLVYSENAEENKALDRLIDDNITEGLHPDLLVNDDEEGED
jgi:hypothetical protein